MTISKTCVLVLVLTSFSFTCSISADRKEESFYIPPGYAVATPKPLSEGDIVTSFKKYLADYVASYKTDRREEVRHTSGGWARNYFEIGEKYGVDLRKTDSLISPYVGTAEFGFIMHSTVFHKTQAEAEADINFVRSMPLRHRHAYAYQDETWVLKSREEYFAILGEWAMCDHDGSCVGEGAK